MTFPDFGGWRANRQRRVKIEQWASIRRCIAALGRSGQPANPVPILTTSTKGKSVETAIAIVNFGHGWAHPVRWHLRIARFLQVEGTRYVTGGGGVQRHVR
jgi:hypothetical protein